MVQKLLWLALAGGSGTLLRYALGTAIQRACPQGFPWGTLIVNLAGCFLFGAFWALAEHKLSLNGEVRTVVLVGFMGAFTTFSTFVFDTNQLISASRWLPAMANVFAQNVVGLGSLLLGLIVGRSF